MRKPGLGNEGDKRFFDLTVAEAMHRLYEIVPKDARLDLPPEVAVEYGEPAERIVEFAKERGADLIVIGVRSAAGRIGAATRLEHATAYKVVAHAPCPVLTVRGWQSQLAAKPQDVPGRAQRESSLLEPRDAKFLKKKSVEAEKARRQQTQNTKRGHF